MPLPVAPHSNLQAFYTKYVRTGLHFGSKCGFTAAHHDVQVRGSERDGWGAGGVGEGLGGNMPFPDDMVKSSGKVERQAARGLLVYGSQCAAALRTARPCHGW